MGREINDNDGNRNFNLNEKQGGGPFHYQSHLDGKDSIAKTKVHGINKR